MNLSQPTGSSSSSDVYVDGSQRNNLRVTVGRPAYVLERPDFEIIIKKDTLHTFLDGFIAAALALFINVLAKIVGHGLYPDKISVDTWEIVAFLIALALAGITSLFALFVKTDRKRLIEEIKSHYRSQPASKP